MVIVVTDGQSQDDVAEAAQRLKDAHVMVYAIGVTNLVNVHQLHQVRINPFHFIFFSRSPEMPSGYLQWNHSNNWTRA